MPSVTNDIPEGNEKQKPGLPENKNLIASGIVVALVIIAVIVIVFMQMPSDNGNKKSPVVTNPAGRNTTAPTITAEITETIRLINTQRIVQTPTTEAPPAVPVDFVLQSGTPSSCGLTCRQMDASITNTGLCNRP